MANVKPKITILDGAGNPIEGAVLTVTSTGNSPTAHTFPATGKSGTATFADAAGLAPGTYDYKLTTPFGPAIEPKVNFADPDSGQTTLRVIASKGILRIRINLNDGKEMHEDVLFTLTDAKGTATDVTAAKTKSGAHEATVDRAVEPGQYTVAIKELDKVKKQGGASADWKIGPDRAGSLKVTVEAGKVAEVRFTLHKYNKVQFIGLQLQPGDKQGFRCATCGSQSDKQVKCPLHKTVDMQPLYCRLCGKGFPAGQTHCDACQARIVEVEYRGATYPACLSCKKYIFDLAAIASGLCPTPGCKESLLDVKIYLGYSNDIVDILARCEIVCKAIEAAHKEVDAESGGRSPETTLKVFMAPEFLFRGSSGAYPIEQISYIMEHLYKTTSAPAYKDWLFVYGTAIGYFEPNKVSSYHFKAVGAVSHGSTTVKLTDNGDTKVAILGTVPTENHLMNPAGQWKLGKIAIRDVVKSDDAHYTVTLNGPLTDDIKDGDSVEIHTPLATEIFNIAMVQKGGPDDNIASLRRAIVYKEKISHIDFLRTGQALDWCDAAGREVFLLDQKTVVLPTSGADEMFAKNPNPLAGEVNKSGLGGGAVFMIDGITFGLEVCLDHYERRLQKFYETRPVGVGKVQIQLIPSWGATIQVSALIAETGTMIFNVDGPEGSDLVEVVNPRHFDRLNPKAQKQLAQPAAVEYEAKDLPDAAGGPDPGGTKKKIDPTYANLLMTRNKFTARVKTPESFPVYVDYYDPVDLVEASAVV